MAAESLWLLLLGVLQGLTEFLPISSSGHLALAQLLWGGGHPEENVAFDVLLHVATLVAVVLYFADELRTLLRGILWPAPTTEAAGGLPPRRLALALVVGTTATAAVFGVNVVLGNPAEAAFQDLRLVGVGLLVTGTLLQTLRRREPPAEPRELSYATAALVGLAQGIAIFPGISRSGATIVTGSLCGLDQSRAARFSFLLSIPAILAALMLKAPDLLQGLNTGGSATAVVWLAAALLAGGVGYACLRLLFRMISRLRLHVFAWYCWALGLGALLLGLWRGGPG